MADYKHVGPDTYGYIEEIAFTPLNKQCEVKYKEPHDNTVEVTPSDSHSSQDMREEYNLVVPNCKCLRK